MNHIGCITTKRAHIVALSQGLADVLPAAFICEAFPDPAKPLTIAVNGTKSDGKKIIADVVTDTLFGHAVSISGRPNWDEIHTGVIDGHSFQTSFINAAWRDNYHSGYSNPQFDLPQTNRSLLSRFNAARIHPGISFVHNANNRVRHKADIQIWLESRFSNLVGSSENFRPSRRHMRYQKTGLRQHFSDITSKNTWVRWCEIKINNKQLLAQPQIRSFMENLHLPDSMAVLNPSWRAALLPHGAAHKEHHGSIPEYGVNLPRSAHGL